jgi:hypothetical protein
MTIIVHPAERGSAMETDWFRRRECAPLANEVDLEYLGTYVAPGGSRYNPKKTTSCCHLFNYIV